MPQRPKSPKSRKAVAKKRPATKPRKVSPADVLRAFPGGVSPHKAYPVRTPDEIVEHAKLLYFIVDENLNGAYSYDAISTTLKRTYPGKCNKTSRATIIFWVKKFGWREQRQSAIEEAYQEAGGIKARQEVYKKLVTGKFGLEHAQLDALINKPATGMTPHNIQKDLRENERALLEATQNRMGLVLVELRAINGTAYNELMRRGDNNELLYKPRSRKQLLDEYRTTTDLLIKLYGIRILQKMAGIETENFDTDKTGKNTNMSNAGTSPAGSSELTDALLQGCNVELPSDIATLALRLFSNSQKGVEDAGIITDAGRETDPEADDGPLDESDDTPETP